MVGALLFSGGSVLLGRRSAVRASFPGVWDMPGGHVEAGESRRAALDRELAEELGVRPAQGRWWRRETQAGLELTVWLVTRWTGTVANRQPHEHDELAWFARHEVSRLAFPHPAFPELLDAAFDAVDQVPV